MDSLNNLYMYLIVILFNIYEITLDRFIKLNNLLNFHGLNTNYFYACKKNELWRMDENYCLHFLF